MKTTKPQRIIAQHTTRQPCLAEVIMGNRVEMDDDERKNTQCRLRVLSSATQDDEQTTDNRPDLITE
jgi:hypothetical protein